METGPFPDDLVLEDLYPVLLVSGDPGLLRPKDPNYFYRPYKRT